MTKINNDLIFAPRSIKYYRIAERITEIQITKIFVIQTAVKARYLLLSSMYEVIS